MSCNVDNRTIFWEDNLSILKNINSESIDLIYLDPPFNKKRSFVSTISTKEKGAKLYKEIFDFKDKFYREDIKAEWTRVFQGGYRELYDFLNTLSCYAEDSDVSYISYMAIRVIEMHRVLKPTGSLYFHCDYTMSHYIKIMLDIIFGRKNFRNEIIWRRAAGRAKGSQHESKTLGTDVDNIFYYSKSDVYVHHALRRKLDEEKDKEEIEKKFPLKDEKGRRYNVGTPIFCQPSQGARPNLCYTFKGVKSPHSSGWRVSREKLEKLDKDGYIIWRPGKRPLRKAYFDEYPGVPIGSLWTTIPPQTFKDRRGNSYSTCKPVQLLSRIIEMSSNEEDIVLDPFCGCATTCVAAEKLKRQWIGIDIGGRAFEFTKKRLVEELKVTGDAFEKGGAKELHFEKEPPTLTNKNNRPSKWIYVVSNPKWEGQYKVGVAEDWRKRLNSYQTSDPERAYEMEYKVQTKNFLEIEREVHKKFGATHEWVQADLQEIKDFIEDSLQSVDKG